MCSLLSSTAVVIQVSVGPYTSPEGGVVNVSVSATNPADRTVTVDVMGVNGTAMGEYILSHTMCTLPLPITRWPGL